MKNVDTMVFEVIGKIPEYIGGAERYRKVYASARNPVLIRKTAELYSSILVALTEIFEYLGENSTGRPDFFVSSEQSLTRYISRCYKGTPLGSQVQEKARKEIKCCPRCYRSSQDRSQLEPARNAGTGTPRSGAERRSK